MQSQQAFLGESDPNFTRGNTQWDNVKQRLNKYINKLTSWRAECQSITRLLTSMIAWWLGVCRWPRPFLWWMVLCCCFEYALRNWNTAGMCPIQADWSRLHMYFSLHRPKNFETNEHCKKKNEIWIGDPLSVYFRIGHIFQNKQTNKRETEAIEKNTRIVGWQGRIT